MKTKFFFLFVLFLGISALTFGQATTADPVEKKDAPSIVTTPDHTKTGEYTGHTTTAKADCKWVDANGDGKCDSCGKTEKECKETCAPKASATTPKSRCASTCPHAKDCGKSGTTTPKKD